MPVQAGLWLFVRVPSSEEHSPVMEITTEAAHGCLPMTDCGDRLMSCFRLA